MALINSVVTWLMKKRFHQIELFMKYPHDVQAEWFNKLISTAKDTEYGRKYDFKSINDYHTFRERLPINDYDLIREDIEQLMAGKQNVLWPTDIKLFAKSSGTTSDKAPPSSSSLIHGSVDYLIVIGIHR